MTEPPRRPGVDWVPIYLVVLVLAAFLLLVGAVGQGAIAAAKPLAPRSATHALPAVRVAAPVAPTRPTYLPDGGRRIFDGKLLVAYYGTAGTGALGVLGESDPDRIMPRLLRAARAFARPGHPVQPVFELIVSVAARGAGPGGDFSNDIPRASVARYLRAAHRHGVLVVLDLQPGRSDFTTQARRWAWALKDPWVGLALDPEWRMGRHGVPGRTIGSVSAAEVNRTSAWLDRLTSSHRLPQKLFLLHQFRSSMVRHIERVAPRAHLALVQHIDGFGTPRAKLATYHRLARPAQFTMGFKLFYDEDVRRMPAARVLRIQPRVGFVSFQ